MAGTRGHPDARVRHALCHPAGSRDHGLVGLSHDERHWQSELGQPPPEIGHRPKPIASESCRQAFRRVDKAHRAVSSKPFGGAFAEPGKQGSPHPGVDEGRHSPGFDLSSQLLIGLSTGVTVGSVCQPGTDRDEHEVTNRPGSGQRCPQRHPSPL